MIFLYSLFGVLGYLWIFWGLFVLVMGLYRAHLEKRLSVYAYVLGAPFLAAGYIIDVVANLVIATSVFMELPKELLVTDRLTRYNEGNYGWRSKVAKFVCENLLDVFDPSGKHCIKQ